jgi:pimeloyl-ACP methyl ester carboxylesterase/DNA-binding winged helix-turn-helix (wHTH) protein
MNDVAAVALSPVPLGRHRFDPVLAELRDAEGRYVTLRAQSMAVLGCLARRAGHLVTKEELLQAVWPGIVVTDDSLVQCIVEIRRALGDHEHCLIRTEKGRGYRLALAHEAVNGASVVPDKNAFGQDIGFARTQDGVKIAYALAGAGYPLVRTAHWMTHLDWDWRSDVFGPRIRALAGAFRYVRYDGRGWGLSDRDGAVGNVDQWLLDLEAVVDAAGLERFALFGPSGGAATAVRYAARHPERVSHLVILGGVVRGGLERGERSTPVATHEAFIRLIEDGWGQDNAAFRQLMTSMLWPAATTEQMRSFNHLQRMASSAATAAQMLRAIAHLNVEAELSRVRCPTLVLHSLHDARVPFDEARLIAAGIPGARLEPLDSPNHTPLLGEPEFERLHQLISEFVR